MFSIAFRQEATGPSSVCEGSDVTLQCVVIFTSSGGVVVEQSTIWSRNGMSIIETFNSSGTFYIPNHTQLVDPDTGLPSDLVITNVRLEDDNTVYTCTTTGSSITSSLMLNVIGIYTCVHVNIHICAKQKQPKAVKISAARNNWHDENLLATTVSDIGLQASQVPIMSKSILGDVNNVKMIIAMYGTIKANY